MICICPTISSIFIIFFISIQTNKHNKFFSRFFISIDPVSYTHLDVYKRQVDNSEFVVGTECQKPKLVMLSKKKNAAIIAAVLFVGETRKEITRK